MPHYFFDSSGGDRFFVDEDGLDLKDIAAAKLEAQRVLPDMVREAMPEGNHRTFVVSVRNERNQVVLRVALSLVVEEGTVDA